MPRSKTGGPWPGGSPWRASPPRANSGRKFYKNTKPYSKKMTTYDPDILAFPCDIAPVIGLSKNEIAFLKRKGCPFFGRKTTVRWVREFIAKEAGAPGQRPPAHPTDSASSKPHAPGAWSGSQVASPAIR